MTKRISSMRIVLLLLTLVWTPWPLVQAKQPKNATVVVAPAMVSMPVNTAQQFTATTTGTTKLPVWSATGGSITQSGYYVAGSAPGIYFVTATLPGNVKNSATVQITSAQDTTAPTVPTNLTATNLTSTSFDLGWNPSTDAVGVTGYGVYANGSLVDTTSGAGTTFSGLPCNTRTDIGIDAFDAAGNRSAQALISVTTSSCVTPPDTTPPTTPTNLSATPTQTDASMTWTASTDDIGVTSYGIYLNGNLRQSSTGTSAVITGLTCGQNYIVAVDATDQAGNRSAKISLPVDTLACSPPVVTPTTLKFSPGADYDTNVVSTAIELRKSTDAVTATPVATQNLGKPAIVSGDATVDISSLVDPLPDGSYYGIVTAINTAATTPSAPSAVFTKGVVPPPPPPPTGIVVTDAFSGGAASPLPAPWATNGVDAPFNRTAAGTAQPSSLSPDCSMYYANSGIGANQYAQAAITVTGGGTGTGQGVAVRMSTTAKTYYRIVVNKDASNNVEVARFNAGTYTPITYRTVTWADGQVLRAEVSGTGTTVTIKVFQGGVQLGADISDTSAGRVLAGNPGIVYSSILTAASVATFEAGDLP
jgi:hypothetical protein